MTPQKSILKLIRQNHKFLIATHVNPDLDAIASELALAEYLKARGKHVVIVHEKPVIRAFHFVKNIRSIKSLVTFRGSYDVAIIVDCGDLNRIGSVKNILQQGTPIINIDHHFTSKSFAAVNLVDPRASSTAEVIFMLFQRWGVTMTKTIAYYLYLGILTDTGSFRYQNTTAQTHRIVAQLVSFEISPAQIYRLAYEDLQPKHLAVLAKVMQGVRYYRGGQVACVQVPQKVLKTAHGEFDIKDKVFSLLRMLRDVQVIVIFSQESARKTRVNFRSTGHADVAAVAQKFSGGGHKAASGCYIEQPMQQAQKIILPEIFKKVSQP